MRTTRKTEVGTLTELLAGLAPEKFSKEAVLLNATFQGEYKTENESWKPFENDAKINCLDGEVRLKGFFQLTSR